MNKSYPEIRVWDRKLQHLVIEKVYGDKFIKLLYETAAGRFLTDGLLSKKFFSQMYGTLQSSSLSARKIKPFVRQFEIPMTDYQEGPFTSFNDFFIRRFKKGKREFSLDPHRLCAFAEGRYLAYNAVSDAQVFPVKGQYLRATELLGHETKSKAFSGGPVVIARLCPVDYHRFHYPDGGKTLDSYQVMGGLHSVNPLALRQRGDIFITNERHVSILETKNFGKLAYIEVGALCVGRIVQSHDEAQPFERGDEKGYFLFGGSTVVLLGEPGRWRIDDDLLEKTARQQETLVRLGEAIATGMSGTSDKF